MNTLKLMKAARKLCALRGLNPDDDVMRFNVDGSIGNVTQRWQLVAEEIDHVYKILQAINETLEDA